MFRKNEDERLTTLIIESFEASRQHYETQRIQRDLRELGETVSCRRIRRLMRKSGRAILPTFGRRAVSCI